jgi:WD40 repeat protein
MNKRSAIFLAIVLFVPRISYSNPPVLKPVRKIGVGWQTGKWGWMSFVAFSPDGTMVASDAAISRADVSGDLTLWSFPEGRLIKKLPAQPTAVSNDWKYYATSHGVREMETGKSLISRGAKVYAGYAFSPDSRYVAETSTGHSDRNSDIRIVELASGKQLRAFGKHDGFSIAISPDGETLASGHWDAVTLWNMITGKPEVVLRGMGRYVDALAFSRDGKLLATGSDAGVLQIWDVQSRTRLHSIDVDGGYGYVSQPAFSPDGRLVAVGIYGTGTVWLIDVHEGKIIDHKKVSDLGCGSVAFSPDGRFLITPSTGGLVTWPYDRGGMIQVFEVSPP